MKKLILPLLLICLLLSGCFGTPSQPTVPPEPTTEPTAGSQPIITAPSPQTRPLYIRTGIIDRTGSVETRTEYRLDGSDQISEVVVYTDGQLTRRYTVQCDANGNPTLWESTTSQIHFTYADNQLQSYQITHGTTVISSTEYTYKDGLLVRVTQKVPLQALELRQDMIYDAEGALLRQDDYRNGTLQSYTIYTLGDNGQTSHATVNPTDGSAPQTITYTYTDSTTITTAADGSYQKQVYDQAGNLCQRIQYDADGEEISCQEYQWKEIQIPLDSQRISI